MEFTLLISLLRSKSNIREKFSETVGGEMQGIREDHVVMMFAWIILILSIKRDRKSLEKTGTGNAGVTIMLMVSILGLYLLLKIRFGK